METHGPTVTISRSTLEAIPDYLRHHSTCGVVLAGSDCGSYHPPFCHRDLILAQIKEALDG